MSADLGELEEVRGRQVFAGSPFFGGVERQESGLKERNHVHNISAGE